MANLHIDERIGVPIVLSILATVLFLFLTPVTLWFSVDTMDIRDADTWQEITVDYDRTISRDFYGEWRAMILEETPTGSVVVCSTAWNPNDYSTKNVLPEPVTLEWFIWTDPECYQLPPGNYEAVVTWSVNHGSLLFQRDISRSDTFQVYGP